MDGAEVARKFLNRRDSVLQNQIPGNMRKYVSDSIEMIETIQLLTEHLRKAKADLDNVCGQYDKSEPVTVGLNIKETHGTS